MKTSKDIQKSKTLISRDKTVNCCLSSLDEPETEAGKDHPSKRLNNISEKPEHQEKDAERRFEITHQPTVLRFTAINSMLSSLNIRNKQKY